MGEKSIWRWFIEDSRYESFELWAYWGGWDASPALSLRELNNLVVLIQYADKPLKAQTLIFITYEALKIYNKQKICLLQQVSVKF